MMDPFNRYLEALARRPAWFIVGIQGSCSVALIAIAVFSAWPANWRVATEILGVLGLVLVALVLVRKSRNSA